MCDAHLIMKMAKPEQMCIVRATYESAKQHTRKKKSIFFSH